ncbi:NUDIX domain-containing protein [Streptomyces sp. NPDC002690]
MLESVDRFTTVVHVHTVVRQDGQLLLSRRALQLPGGGWWQLPGGHLNADESVVAGAIRELAEETGVVVETRDLAFRHLMHHRNRAGASRVSVFFEALRWSGEPRNMEPDRCCRIGFFAEDELPSPLLPQVAGALTALRDGTAFSVAGWADEPAPVG